MFNRLSAYSPQALAVLRFMTGLLFLEHGTQKMFNFPPMTMAAPRRMETIMLEVMVGIGAHPRKVRMPATAGRRPG